MTFLQMIRELKPKQKGYRRAWFSSKVQNLHVYVTPKTDQLMVSGYCVHSFFDPVSDIDIKAKDWEIKK